MQIAFHRAFPPQTETPQRMLSAPRKTLFCVEGSIGAGKSTVLQRVADELKLKVVLEPVDEWNHQQYKGKSLLAAMYDGSLPHAMFQLAIMPGRVSGLAKALFENDVVVCERSPWSERTVFAEPNLSADDFALYKWAQNALIENVVGIAGPIDIVFIHLDVDATVALHRIRRRGRAGEAGIGIALLEEMADRHCELMELRARDVVANGEDDLAVDVTVKHVKVDARAEAEGVAAAVIKHITSVITA
jgi:deoxyadenosine/deoxycytidine kinase